MCDFFDPQIAQGCHEPMAEVIKEKERANFCNFFQLRPNAFQPKETGTADKAQAELDALFGTPGADTTTDAAPPTPSDSNHAQAELERLFDPSNKDKD
jgi:hypothetical protein